MVRVRGDLQLHHLILLFWLGASRKTIYDSVALGISKNCEQCSGDFSESIVFDKIVQFLGVKEMELS